MMNTKMCLKYGITGLAVRSRKCDGYKINPVFADCRKHNDCTKCREFITIDPDIAWEVYQLNKAGLETDYSCSGHLEDMYYHFYISFKEDYKKILDYFNIVKPKYLELEECHYFYIEGDDDKELGSITEDDIKYREDKIVLTGDKHYVIRPKNCIKYLDKYYDAYDTFISLENPDFLIYHRKVMAEVRNLICELCV